MAAIFQDNPLIKNWWAFVIRGLFAILFGVLALLMPALTMRVLTLIFAAYALFDGLFALVGAVRGIREEGRAMLLLLEGIIGIGAAALAFFAPVLATAAFVFVVAFWAIVTGVLELATAIRLRKVIPNEWLLGLAGVLSVAFGVLLFVWPLAGALTLTFMLGVYAIAFGAMLIGLGFQLRSYGQRVEVLGTPHYSPS